MRTERWPTATVLALCVVAALLGAGLAKQHLAEATDPNPWVMPR